MEKLHDLGIGTGAMILTQVNDTITPDLIGGSDNNLTTAIINLIIAGVTLFKLLKKPRTPKL